MELISNKFKYLFAAQEKLGAEIVPTFIKIGSEANLPIDFFPGILRSAIGGEASESKLLSGKSLSIPNIDSMDDFKMAYQQILGQPTLEEVILQKQIVWDYHLTLISESDFIFIEMKAHSKENLKPQFFYWTPLGHTADKNNFFPMINSILKKLKPFTKSHPLWLLELGLKNNDLFLFQVQPIEVSLLSTIFSQNLAYEMLLSRHKFQASHGIFSMMKTELSANRFRKRFLKAHAYPPSWVFLNWEYIFHYFRIFCMIKKMKPSQESFSSFLTTAGYDKNWMGEIVRLHFKIANQLRVNEAYEETNFIFDQNSALIFLGKGKVEGVVGREFIRSEELTPDFVYNLGEPKIILTKTLSLLSHGILAAAEMKMMVVAGIPDDMWDSVSDGDSIFLDFDKREIRIK